MDGKIVFLGQDDDGNRRLGVEFEKTIFPVEPGSAGVRNLPEGQQVSFATLRGLKLDPPEVEIGLPPPVRGIRAERVG